MNFFRRKTASHMKEVEEVCQSMSAENACAEMYSMMEDLMAERDSLRNQLQQSNLDRQDLREQRDQALQFNQSHLERLLGALDIEHPVSKRKDVPVSAEEATEMTIRSLTKQIEKLSARNSELTEDKTQLNQRVSELEHENEARKHKIEALEVQFKSINKTRQKMVKKIFMERTNEV